MPLSSHQGTNREVQMSHSLAIFQTHSTPTLLRIALWKILRPKNIWIISAMCSWMARQKWCPSAQTKLFIQDPPRTFFPLFLRSTWRVWWSTLRSKESLYSSLSTVGPFSLFFNVPVVLASQGKSIDNASGTWSETGWTCPSWHIKINVNVYLKTFRPRPIHFHLLWKNVAPHWQWSHFIWTLTHDWRPHRCS